MTTVSVVIPTYNRKSALRQAINNVLDQTYEDLEIIVVDDGSTDKTENMINNFECEYLQYIRCESNQGANHARNIGIIRSEGDFISFLDTDDRLSNSYHEETIEAINSSSVDCGGAFTSFLAFRNGRIDYLNRAPNTEIDQTDLIHDNIIGGFSCTIFKSEVFDNVGLLDEDLESSQDYDFYLRVLNEYTMIGIDKILVRYHLQSDSISTNVDKKKQGNSKIIEKHRHTISEKRISTQLSSEGIYHGLDSDLTTAKKKFKEAISYDLYSIKAYYFYFFSMWGARVFIVAYKITLLIRSVVFWLYLRYNYEN